MRSSGLRHVSLVALPDAVASTLFGIFDVMNASSLMGLPAADAVGPGFVEGNLVAHYLAGAGLALLVIGVLREVRGATAGGEDDGGSAAAPALPPQEERP